MSDADRGEDPRPVARLDDVTRRFDGGLVALDGVSLSVHEGEFVSVVGPSGCGKSTLLSLLAGLAAPDAGRVWRRDARPGEVGMVFQEATLMPWADVRANVMLPLTLLGEPRGACARRADEALARVGLDGFAQARPFELSGGMRMRAAIARALVTRPRLLLLDEPFGALDELTREAMNDQLLDLWASSGLTCVFVTHSLYEAVYLSTRVVLMSPRPGRIRAEHRVDWPYPRGEAFRADPSFTRLRSALSARLREDAVTPAGDVGP